MDSISQLALGASIGIAVMGRRTAAWKAALWGGVAGTLPDLDVIFDHGDAVLNMVLHRGHSHSILWTMIAGALIGLVAARVHGQWYLLMEHGHPAGYGYAPVARFAHDLRHPAVATLYRRGLWRWQHLHHRPSVHTAFVGGRCAGLAPSRTNWLDLERTAADA